MKLFNRIMSFVCSVLLVYFCFMGKMDFATFYAVLAFEFRYLADQ